MKLIAKDPNFRTKVADSFTAQAFMQTLGASISDIMPGSVRIDLPFAEGLTQQHGFLHAGAVAAIADSACGYAALTLMSEEAAVLTVEYKVNLLAPAVGERFYCYGKVKKAGRTLTLCQSDVLAAQDEKEILCASLVATIMAVEGRGFRD